ncbi:MAG: DNA internalization-related competence protein ComEC/Rec2 [Clostridia bacterium]|nr:DNA internalization-related competence protein ComEC/Rec2 [Clostridia bacterium]
MAATLAYLSGVLLSVLFALSSIQFVLLSMLICASGVIRLKRRRSVLFFVLCFMLLLGNMRAGQEIARRDVPTAPGVQIEGVVSRIEKPYRVFLSDVQINGKASGYAHDVVVTLMQQEDAPVHPYVGQHIEGKGRLFAPDEKRNPGAVSWRITSICKGYELSGYLLPGWQARGEAVFSFGECMRICRSKINERIERLFGEHAPLFQGIMLGDRSSLAEQLTAAMRLTGTAHILTVSGMHLSMIAAVVSAVLGGLRLGRKQRLLTLSVFLVLFTGVTGAAVGTIRACIMAILRELAKVRGRRYEPLTALSFAALCITLVQPLWLLNASFQFSFFVVLCIQLFAHAFAAFIARWRPQGGRMQYLYNLFAVSLSAQLGSIPMQLMLYGYVPLLSLPMNLLCGMILPLLLLGGWFAVGASLFSVPLGTGMAHGLSVVALGFEFFSMLVAGLKGALVRLPAPHGITVLLIVALLFLLTSRIRFGRQRRLAACLVFLVAAGSYAVRFDLDTRYVQLDVGQGDGALFRRGNRAVLIDVGPADNYEMLRYLRHEGLYVDAVILSHLDEDHAGALGVLLGSEVGIPAVITADHADEGELSPAVLTAFYLLDKSNIALHEVRQGDRINVNGISLDVLSPDDELAGSNERSLLLYASVEDVTFLLTGDLPIDCEPHMVPQADVLKVAHHGSKNSTSDTFAAMASPEIAVISVGADNGYGHPHERVLDALGEAQILRTDRHGCITLHVDDGKIRPERYVRFVNE